MAPGSSDQIMRLWGLRLPSPGLNTFSVKRAFGQVCYIRKSGI